MDIDVQQLWKENLMTMEGNRTFVKCHFLERLLSKPIDSKFRTIPKLVQDTMAGFKRSGEDLWRKEKADGKETYLIAAKVMQWIVICGAKQLSWTEERQRFVALSFGSALCLPDNNPYKVLSPGGELLAEPENGVEDVPRANRSLSPRRKKSRKVPVMAPRFIPLSRALFPRIYDIKALEKK